MCIFKATGDGLGDSPCLEAAALIILSRTISRWVEGGYNAGQADKYVEAGS